MALTLDRALGDFAKADILIEDGLVREVRPDIAASDAAVIEGANRIAIPGFVDNMRWSVNSVRIKVNMSCAIASP
jgi:dihydroorotase-like cyclic amidohydrolase